MGHHRNDQRLQRKLDRLNEALGPREERLDRQGRRARRRGRRGGGGVVMAVGLGLLVSSLVTGHTAWLTAAFILLFVGGAMALGNLSETVMKGLGSHDPSKASVGMGATVAGDAVVEPGAIVEMGATVGSGAVIRAGAVVRMGATVMERGVVESGAVIGWGATVHRGARVGAASVIGAGASVASEAVVPENTRLLPGSSWTRGIGAAAPAAGPTLAQPVADPREARISAACARIEAELAQATPAIRERVGGSAQLAASLRATCADLMAREKALRSDASPEAQAFLQQEQAELEKRIGEATDDRVRASLQSAVAAIADQRRQRDLIRESADRIDAELTRLSWTLDGMATQLVRLRNAGDAASVPPEAMSDTVRQLHDEIDAISDALEEVSAPPRVAALAPVESAGPDEPMQPQRDRVR